MWRLLLLLLVALTAGHGSGHERHSRRMMMSASAARLLSESLVDDGAKDGNADRQVSLALAQLAEAARRVVLDDSNIVIYVHVNKGFLDMLLNFALHLRPLGYENKFLIFAVDEATHEFAEKRWPGQSLTLGGSQLDQGGFQCNSMGEGKGDNLGQEFTYNSDGFNFLTNQRPFIGRALLSLGFSPLLADVDMVWVADPLPFFNADKSFDVYISSDRKEPPDERWNQPNTVAVPEDFVESQDLNFCTCLMLMRSTSGSLLLANAWIQQIKRMGCSGEVTHDQMHLNLLLAHLKRGLPELFPRIALLPRRSFPNGAMMGSTTERMRNEGHDGVVTVHANYIIGKDNKMAALKKAGVWLLDGNGEEAQRLNEDEMKGLAEALRPKVEKAAAKVAVKKTVIFTFVSSEQVQLLENWAQWLKQANANDGRVLAITAEDSVAEQLQGRWASAVINLNQISPSVGPKLDAASLLPIVVRQLLEGDYTAIYSEPDTVWLKSPMDMFEDEGTDVFLGPTSLGEEGQNSPTLLHSDHTTLDLQLGLGTLVVRPTASAKSLLDRTVTSFYHSIKEGSGLRDASISALCSSLSDMAKESEVWLKLLRGEGFVHERVSDGDGKWTEEARESATIVHIDSREKLQYVVDFMQRNNLWVQS